MTGRKKDLKAGAGKPVAGSGETGTGGNSTGTQLSVEDLLAKIAEARALAEKLKEVIDKNGMSDAELHAQFEKELGPDPERRLLEVALNLAGVQAQDVGFEEGLAMLKNLEEAPKPRPGRFRKLI
jgi:hypothetical protein